MLRDSLRFTEGKVIGSNEVIKLELNDIKLLGTIFGNVYGITLVIDVGIDLGSLYLSFDGSNGGQLKGLLSEDSLGSTDGKVLDFDEGTKLRSTIGKFLGTVLGNVNVITLGIDVGTELGCLYGTIDSSNFWQY